jgi:hypothetical protein
VLKPANSVLWHHTVIGWLDQHLKQSPTVGAAVWRRCNARCRTGVLFFFLLCVNPSPVL